MYSGKINIGRINLRISLLFSTLFIVTILLLFGVVFFLTNYSLKNTEVGFIQHKLLGYWALAQTKGVDAFLQGIYGESLLIEGTPYFLRLSNAENETQFVIQPEGWKAFFQDDRMVLPQVPEEFITLTSPQHPYSLIIAGIPVTEDLYLQIGTSTEERERTLSLLLRTFTILVFPLAGISFLIGSFLTSRILAPLQGLTSHVQSIIRTGNLQERVPPPKGRDELGDLVTLFNTMLDRISLLVHSMRQTIDTLAHDLKTPLTRFRGMVELSLQGEDPTRWKTALADGIEESEKLLRMMNTILDISAAEAGALPLRFENLNAGELLEDIADLYSFVAEERGIQLIRALPPSSLPIRADPNRLRQVIGNLLDNALKYSAPGTTVRIEAQQMGSTLVIQVQDQGRGIDPEDLPHIWERLYRGKGVRQIPGLGLGLSLVKAIVEAHKGSIRAFTNPSNGKGAIFEIQLPSITKL